jgi:hypothetical protein
LASIFGLSKSPPAPPRLSVGESTWGWWSISTKRIGSHDEENEIVKGNRQKVFGIPIAMKKESRVLYLFLNKNNY